MELILDEGLRSCDVSFFTDNVQYLSNEEKKKIKDIVKQNNDD